MKINKLDYSTLSKNVEPAIIIRLTAWKPKLEEIESGHNRRGGGWRDGMSSEELYDSVRAWWQIRPETVAAWGATHAIASAGTLTRAVYRIDGWIGPRDENGKVCYAFYGVEIKSGAIYDQYFGYRGRIAKFKKGDRHAVSFWPPKE